jgi:tetratricopeptide (TPR) repeat protein
MAEPEDKPVLRGASPEDVDRLRAAVRKTARTGPTPTPARAPLPAARAAPPVQSQAQALMLAPDLTRIVDEGRALLEADPKSAHAIFEKAYRKNVNDVRVLSNYGLTLVLVEGDRQRGIRFCEEAVRRGPPTTEMLVNLAKALVVTRNKEQAVRALRRAQELSPNDPRVGQEFIALGLRRPPPIPWLSRTSFLNKWIGRLTWRLSKKRFDPTRPPD